MEEKKNKKEKRSEQKNNKEKNGVNKKIIKKKEKDYKDCQRVLKCQVIQKLVLSREIKHHLFF